MLANLHKYEVYIIFWSLGHGSRSRFGRSGGDASQPLVLAAGLCVEMGGDAERAINQGPADVLLCHDHPSLGYRLKGLPIPEADELSSEPVSICPAKGAG